MRDHPDGPSGDLSMIRIATAGYQHESNTFSSIPASLDLWRRSGILEDAASIRAEYASSQSTLAGFFAEAGEHPDVELVPLFFTRLMPMGAITPEATDFIFDRIIAALRDNGPWDAVLLPLHGAAVSASHPDADGELVRRVRALVGPRVPIGVALDMHANIAPQLVSNADIVTVYQTNPHIDAFEQARHCAQLLLRTRVARQVTFGRQRFRLALELHIEDNGPGVPEDIRDRIFHPLVSGREGGSGLGLTLAQTFVQQHSGTIECDSIPGRTLFKILIPLP
jgi:microcystin degradation protein MlrC